MDNHGKAWSIDHDQQLMENPDAPDSYFSSCLSRSPNAIKCRRNHLAAKMFQNDPSTPLENHVRRMNADFAQTSLLLIEWNEKRASFKSLLDHTACKRKAGEMSSSITLTSLSPFFKPQQPQPKPAADIPAYWHDMDDEGKIKAICQSIREEGGNLPSVFNDPEFLPCLIQHYPGFEAYARVVQARTTGFDKEMSYRSDDAREMRTMVLLSLPYPPLPVLAARLEDGDGRLQEDDVTTSHTLIAKALNESMARNDPDLNDRRMHRQRRVLQEFLHAMATEGFYCDPERLYLLYCRYSLEHIATYFPPGHPLDIRFQPLSYIVKNDRTHQKLAEYLAAQSILFEDPVPITRSQYLCYEPNELFMAVRDRLGHAVTDEERARIQPVEE